MELVPVNPPVVCPKQLGEVLDLIEKVIVIRKSGGDLTEAIPALLKAVDGVAELPEEVKADPHVLIEAALVRVNRIVKAVLA